jgi:(2Fe-2S) ferredoxin
MGQYDKHVFVCTFGPWCKRDGDTEGIVKRLKRGVAAAGLTGKVRINKAGCFNQCGHGPMVVIYPQGRWYAGVTPADADEIVSQDLVNDEPVLRLLYRAGPGDNKDLSRYPAEWVAEEQAKKAE